MAPKTAGICVPACGEGCTPSTKAFPRSLPFYKLDVLCPGYTLSWRDIKVSMPNCNAVWTMSVRHKEEALPSSCCGEDEMIGWDVTSPFALYQRLF